MSRAYTEAQRSLSTRTVQVDDSVWCHRLDNGDVLSLGVDSKVNPRKFDRLTLYYSHPAAQVRTRIPRDMVTPVEAQHHKYAHTIKTSVIVARRGPAEDQDLAQRVLDFYAMLPRHEVLRIVNLSKQSLLPTMTPQFRRIVNDCVLPPEVVVHPQYFWKPRVYP